MRWPFVSKSKYDRDLSRANRNVNVALEAARSSRIEARRSEIFLDKITAARNFEVEILEDDVVGATCVLWQFNDDPVILEYGAVEANVTVERDGVDLKYETETEVIG